MNAFIEYGKANQLSKTWGELHIKNEKIEKIIDLMQGVDHALSLCDVDTLANNIKQLYLKLGEPITVKSSNEEFIKVLCGDIKEDYKGIVQNGEVDIFELVKWATNKGFIQQAITLIESKMPGQMVKDGYFSYCKNKTQKDEVCKNIIKDKLDLKSYKANDFDHYMFQEKAMKYKNDIEDENEKEEIKKFTKLYTYKGDETVAKLYADLWNRRNNANHAGEKTMSYEDTEDLVTKFIKAYEAQENSIIENKDGFEAITLTKEDVEKRLKYFVVVHTVKNNKNGKEKANAYQWKMLEIIRSKNKKLGSTENSQRIYRKDTPYFVEIKDYLERKGTVYMTIPNSIFMEMESRIKDLIRNTNHKIYVIEDRFDAFYCVKVLDKNSV